jgi:hypothetical protein
MKTTIDLWHKVWPDPGAFVRASAQDLERFAALVRADEREACAKLCDEQANELYESRAHHKCAEYLAEQIRARGNK